MNCIWYTDRRGGSEGGSPVWRWHHADDDTSRVPVAWRAGRTQKTQEAETGAAAGQEVETSHPIYLWWES